MADMKATVTANVDCTALIQADLAALLFELVGDLRERCKRLEADAKPRERLEHEIDKLMRDRDEHQAVFQDMDTDREDLRQKLATVKGERDKLFTEVENLENSVMAWQQSAGSWQEKHAEVTAERDELRAQAERRPWMEWQPPYQWQVGDMIVRSGSLRSVLETRERSVRPEGWYEGEFVSQEFLEGYGWKLHRKASDSTGTNGEGQP